MVKESSQIMKREKQKQSNDAKWQTNKKCTPIELLETYRSDNFFFLLFYCLLLFLSYTHCLIAMISKALRHIKIIYINTNVWLTCAEKKEREKKIRISHWVDRKLNSCYLYFM